MRSYWGVDHGVEVSKRYGFRKLVGGAALGAGAAAGAHKIASSTDPDFQKKAKKNRDTYSNTAAAGAGATGLLMAGPAVGVGMAAGAGGAARYLTRDKKRKP